MLWWSGGLTGSGQGLELPPCWSFSSLFQQRFFTVYLIWLVLNLYANLYANVQANVKATVQDLLQTRGQQTPRYQANITTFWRHGTLDQWSFYKQEKPVKELNGMKIKTQCHFSFSWQLVTALVSPSWWRLPLSLTLFYNNLCLSKYYTEHSTFLIKNVKHGMLIPQTLERRSIKCVNAERRPRLSFNSKTFQVLSKGFLRAYIYAFVS